MPQQIDVRDHRKCNDHDSLRSSRRGSRRIVTMILRRLCRNVDVSPDKERSEKIRLGSFRQWLYIDNRSASSTVCSRPVGSKGLIPMSIWSMSCNASISTLLKRSTSSRRACGSSTSRPILFAPLSIAPFNNATQLPLTL